MTSSTSTPQPFPDDWRRALVLVAHPDDPEYGMAAAVAKWTTAGREVGYALACRGEAGIAGMAPGDAGPLREAEQRRAAALVGVHDLQFWDFPDSAIRDTPALRARIGATLVETAPQMVLCGYGGPEFGPGQPNQRDHIEFAAAVTAAYDALDHPPRWLFQQSPEPSHIEIVDDFTEVAVAALAAHEQYLTVLDPQTPVAQQARQVIDVVAPPHPDTGARVVGFTRVR
ncbi:PIG-L deacetylase family protein [Mycolicibacillus parakoreensis]|uniref:PIG-L family deacetylase n=1 Tax=Mycolicibacillus parakoreensis TaxID=1069221 RepID=A0ABY3U1Q4_9MYCO|nr:PIG-L family deacetylase [Mycolicibacillus parakoreensis]ULN51880.1 PIG-L family deacetylase [Mycolicibacillus parakoreensis]